MSYNEDITKKIMSELETKRQKAIVISENRKAELYKTVPELENIIFEKNNIGINMSREIFKAPNQSSEIVDYYRQKSAKVTRDMQIILNRLNLDENYLKPPFSCDKCDDTGFINGNRCKCLQDAIVKEKHRKLNQTSSLKLKGFSEFNLNYYPNTPDETTGIIPKEAMTSVFEFAKKYAETFSMNSRNILMLGGTGLGKTHLSLAIANEVIKKGYGVIYGSAPNLITEIENEKFSKTKTFKDTLGSLLESDLLILDDLGSEFQTSFTVSAIYTIVNTRLSRGLPTVINTNLTYKDFENMYFSRIVSRITNNYESLFFWGNDIRRLIKDNRN